jgi:two-component system NtrC family sensor kinase
MSGEKILVVDNRRENLLFLADSVLRPEGYDVMTAMDGKQALDKALAEEPDLIITDLKMPRMSGLEMVAALHKAGADIPVILTTFYGSEQTAIQAFRMGVRDYVIKPYDTAEMLASVERALVERRLRRETKDLKQGVAARHHLEARVRQLHSLCGIGRALTSFHAPDEVMQVAVEAAIYLTEADCGQLFLINRETQQLELRAVRGPSDPRATCVQQTGVDQTTARVMETGQAVVGERSGGGEEKVPRLAVPLRVNDRIIGALGVDGKSDRAFDESDRYQLGILANFAAVAVTNARLVASLKEQLASQPERSVEREAVAPAVQSPASVLESIAGAQQLAAQLRSLAVAAEELVLNLQERAVGQ